MKIKFIRFLIFIIAISFILILIYFLKSKVDDNAILSKDPWQTMNPNFPFYTRPLKENEIPHQAIKIFVQNNQCQPNNFQVKAGERVILILRSSETDQNIIDFEDEALELVKIITDGKEPRGIMFQAPFQKGDYSFWCGKVSSKDKQKGVMSVR